MAFSFFDDVLCDYSPCPICGTWHDDGAIIQHEGKIQYICFDCNESLEEIKKQDKNEYNKRIAMLFENE